MMGKTGRGFGMKWSIYLLIKKLYNKFLLKLYVIYQSHSLGLVKEKVHLKLFWGFFLVLFWGQLSRNVSKQNWNYSVSLNSFISPYFCLSLITLLSNTVKFSVMLISWNDGFSLQLIVIFDLYLSSTKIRFLISCFWKFFKEPCFCLFAKIVHRLPVFIIIVIINKKHIYTDWPR